jgi:membrane-bound lytic murein transglycosylase B
MLRNLLWLAFFGLLVGGCASDGKMEASDNSSAAPGGEAVSSPKMSAATATEPSSTSPAMSDAAATESNSAKQPGSSKNRIAAGIDEETLDTCLAQIPGDATTGQRMMAEQTCRRNFSTRR